MNAILVVIASLVIVANVIANKASTVEKNEQPDDNSQVLADEVATETASPEENKPLAQAPSPSASPVSDPKSLNTNAYSYPESSTENGVMKTNDSPDVVTEWYKTKIREGGFSIKNFVQTSVNGESKNVLKAESSTKSISVTITGNSEGSKIEITSE